MSLHHLFGSLLHHPHPTQAPVEEEGHIISKRLHELLDLTDSEDREGAWDEPTADVGAGFHESAK